MMMDGLIAAKSGALIAQYFTGSQVFHLKLIGPSKQTGLPYVFRQITLSRKHLDALPATERQKFADLFRAVADDLDKAAAINNQNIIKDGADNA